MASIYSQENVDIVSTLRNDIYYNRNNDKLFHAGLERSKGSFVQVDDSITVIANITKPSFEQTELSQLSKKFSCQYSELIQQFFFAEIDSLEDLWDPILSSQDHYHMLVTAKKKGLKLLACQGLEILHDKGKCQRTEADFPIPKGLKLRPESDMEEDYELARHENADSRIKYFMKKFKIKEFVTESGSTWIVRGNELEKYPSDHSGQTVHRVTENQQFFDDWLVYINSNRAGWEYLKYPGPAYSDLLRVANYGQCTTMVRTDPWIKGAQAFKFWRNEEIYTGDELDAGKFYFRRLMYNEQCPIAEHFWHLEEVSKSIPEKLYYVTVTTGTDFLPRLYSSIEAASTGANVEIVIVWMNDGNSFKNFPPIESSIKINWVEIGPPFSRSVGLRAGIEYVKSMTEKSEFEKTTIFTIDDSIILPSNFSNYVIDTTITSQTAIAPVVYKCNKCRHIDMHTGEIDYKMNLHFSKYSSQLGHWNHQSFGLIGFTLADYEKTKFDESWGYHWGGEDVDFYDRLSSKILVLRPLVEGLYYLKKRDVEKMKIDNPYYEHRQVYAKKLPISPMSVEVTNEKFINRMINFSRQELGIQKNSIGHGRIFRTYIDNGDHAIYTGKFKTEDGKETFFRLKSSLSPVINTNGVVYTPNTYAH